MLILGHGDIRELLRGNESDVLRVVGEAYLAHAAQQSALPHSSFLRLPDGNRIIALPAYLGGPQARAGIKWIASFPGNVQAGLARASAVIVLNSTGTGQPIAVMEGSVISAQRTAASAALAVSALAPRVLGSLEAVTELGVIGCGVINAEVIRFVRHLCPGLRAVHAYDLQPANAGRLAASCEGLRLEVCREADEVLGLPVVSIATTAQQPHLARVPKSASGSIILHLSLRDFTPEVILENANVVDDIDHVCREQTSPHLAEQAAGHRGFLHATLADLLSGQADLRLAAQTVIFSPFGLGVLDLALASRVMELAVSRGKGTAIKDFGP